MTKFGDIPAPFIKPIDELLTFKEFAQHYTTLRQFIDAHEYAFSGKNLAMDELRSEDFNITAIERFLADWGIRKLAFAGHGYHCLFFDTINNQTIRIKLDRNGTRPKSPYVLQPLRKKKVGPFVIEVLPKVYRGKTAAIKPEEVEELVTGLAHEQPELFFYDCQDENVGRLHDGTAIVMDGEASIMAQYASLAEKKIFANILKAPNLAVSAEVAKALERVKNDKERK